MKRVLCIAIAILICVSLACPVLAADTFVPSIGYKDHPSYTQNEDGSFGWIFDEEGEILFNLCEDCLLITPVSEATTSTKIPEEARKTLLEIYGKLSDGSMKIPYGDLDASLKDKDMVIRDLFDVSLVCSDAIEHMATGDNLTVTFEGINPEQEVTVTMWVDGAWVLVPSKNNGDGTLTVELPATGTVAFSVPAGSNRPPTGTGDASNLVLWAVMLSVSAAALVVLLLSRRSLVQK